LSQKYLKHDACLFERQQSSVIKKSTNKENYFSKAELQRAADHQDAKKRVLDSTGKVVADRDAYLLQTSNIMSTSGLNFKSTDKHHNADLDGMVGSSIHRPDFFYSINKSNERGNEPYSFKNMDWSAKH